MFYLQKLLIKNNISIIFLSNYLNIQKTAISKFLHKERDLSIENLNLIKDLFVNKGIISNDFDIADFFDEVEK